MLTPSYSLSCSLHKIFLTILVFYIPTMVSAQMRSSELKNLQSYELSGRFNETSCLNDKSSTCITAGFIRKNNKMYPYLIRSSDGKKTFEFVKNPFIDNVPGALLTVSCTNDNNGALCIAVGYLGENRNEVAPLLIQSTDGGKNWSHVFISGLTNGIIIREVKCKGSSCIAKGDQTINNILRSIWLQTTNKGETWHIIDKITFKSLDMNALRSDPLPGGSIFVCSSINDHCVAIGKLYFDTYYSIDKGQTWTKADNGICCPGVSTKINDLKCGKDGMHCVAVGGHGSMSVLGISKRTDDGGLTWDMLEHIGPCDSSIHLLLLC
jgi:hypothetical protein